MWAALRGFANRFVVARLVLTAAACLAVLPLCAAAEADTLPPTMPTDLVAIAVSTSRIALTWTEATDNVGVASYKVFRGGELIATAGTESYEDTGLSAGTTYLYTVSACDAAGNCSVESASAWATTAAPPDVQPPGVPSGLVATAVSRSQITLRWGLVSDNVGVASYKVYRNGTLIGQSTYGAAAYSDRFLAAGTIYSYSVSACDAAGNCSGNSSAATATTLSAGPEVDQEYLPHISLVMQARSIDYAGQSFTIGRRGRLERIDLALMKDAGATADVEFRLFRIINGVADVANGIVLVIPNASIATGNVSDGMVPVSVNLAPYDVQVAVGETWGMTVHSEIGFNQTPAIHWFGGCRDNLLTQCDWSGKRDGYPLGSQLQINAPLPAAPSVFASVGADFAFRTYVFIPGFSTRPARMPGDLTGDGKSDVLWRNAATGENYLYPLDGTTILGTEGYLRTVSDLSWQIAARGDLDGDGRADILWRHMTTGENYVYFMNGTSIVREGYLRTVPDQNWQVAGTGDFDGDSKDDILWRNELTGQTYVYPMDGLSIKSGERYLRTVTDRNWQVAGVADFDGDGKSDILWRNGASGENYLYLMDGTTIKPAEGFIRTVADPAWQIAGVGDFDGDGRADIVWRHATTGENYLYPMSGTAIKPSEAYLRTVADLDWRIAATGDYDGDGRSDVLWRNSTTGENYIYPMIGTAIKPSEGFLRPVPVGRWNVVSN
jgi:chitodextrinase